MFRILLILLFSVLVVSNSMSLSGEDNKITYDMPELVDLALKRSELLSASEKSVESAKWAKGQSMPWQNPIISFNAGNKSASGQNGFAYDIGLTQPFYFPGKQKLAGDIAGFQEKKAGLDRDSSRLFVRYSVIKLAYQYAVALELTKHLEERVIRFISIKKYLASRPITSPKKKMEKHIVEMKLILLMKNLDEIRFSKDVIWSKLNLFLNFQEPVTIKTPWFEKGKLLEINDLLAIADKGNIDLKKHSLVLERTKMETHLARKFALPDFGLSLLYREDQVPDIQRFIGAGITFSVPMWNTNKAGVKSLEADIEAKKAIAVYVKRETAQALVSSYFEYEIARKNLERLPVSMFDDVHNRLAEADGFFDTGLIDFVMYGEVENQSYDMHLAILAAQYEYVEKYAALLVLQGSEDFTFPVLVQKKSIGVNHVP